MTTAQNNELIIVRSLTDSDMGLFEAQRATATSKQRALNINAKIAKRLLSPRLFSLLGTTFHCRILFGDIEQESDRHIGKVGKNWRLGGNKITGNAFSALDSRDFAIIKSVENNDGDGLITILFLSKTLERLKHADVVRLLEPLMRNSMALFMEGSAGFPELAALFPVAKVRTGKLSGNGASKKKPVAIQ